MAATTNRRFTELYRNSEVYATKQSAITGLYNHELLNSLKDGEPVLARYMATFTWDNAIRQYVISNTDISGATFTRLLSNETSTTSTKEYIAGDFINVTTEGTTKSYKCKNVPSESVAVPVGTSFSNTSYFTEIVETGGSTGIPQNIQTIRVLMGVATAFSDTGSEFQKNPPKGRLTIFEEDDVIREMINKANISSPDGTIKIADTVSGKTIEVNLGSTLVKNITEDSVDYGKIDVNIDNRTIIKKANGALSDNGKLTVNHGSTLFENSESGQAGKLDVNCGDTLVVSTVTGKEGQINVKHGNTIVESVVTGQEGELDVNYGNTIAKSSDGVLDVKHGNTLVESATSGEVGKLDVRTGNTIKVSAGGSGNPAAGTLDVKTGTTLNVSAGGADNPELGTINVNIDEQSIKQYDSGTNLNKLYVNVDNASGLEIDTTNGIQTKIGKALAFRTGDSTDANNGKIDVQYDDNTVKLNTSNKLYVDFNTTGDSGIGVTMERKANGSTYYGWGVKHGNSITEDDNGIHVNFDDISIKQNTDEKLYVKHNTTIVTDSTNGIGVNIDNSSIKQNTSSNKLYVDIDGKSIKQSADTTNIGQLYVNIDEMTIKQSTATGKQGQLYVNIDNDTLISNQSTGVISVNPTSIGVYGEDAIEIANHVTTGTTVDGKKVKLKINSTTSTGYTNILSQSSSGLKAHLNLRPCTTEELSTLGSNVKEAYKLVAHVGDNETPIGGAIKIYKDSSLANVYLGHVDDKLTDEDQSTHESPNANVTSGTGDDALCFIYQLANGNYKLTAVNVESFITESEFKDGLTVNSSTHEVSVKLYDGLAFHTETGSNASIQSRIGNGLQFNSSATAGEKPIELRLGGGLEFGTGTEDQKPVKVKVGTGIGINTDNQIYINYGTVGSSIRPVYWDGTTHAPVAIAHTIQTDVPENAVFTDTLYYSGNEITIDSTNNHINHNVKLSSGFTGTTTATTISGFGGTGTIKVPVLSVNQYGHVTSASEAEMSISMPEAKITDATLVWPTYTQGHLSPAWVTAYTDNAIAVNTEYDTAFNKLDNKIKALADELSDAEDVFTQGLEDEPRYFARSTTATASSGTAELTATLADNRAYNLFDGTKVDVYFANDQTVSSATLAIAGSNTSVTPVAKYLVYNDELFNAELIEAGTTLALVYDAIGTITVGSTTHTGIYRVVGGVGSGSGSGSTNGITEVKGSDGIIVTKGYQEVTINSSAAPYSSTWFTGITPSSTTTIYRVTTPGNYYNMAYKWNGTKYVLSTDIEETVSARLGKGLVFGSGTDGEKPIEISLAANMIPEGSISGSSDTTEIDNLATLLKFTSDGKLAMENTWDCGTY